MTKEFQKELPTVIVKDGKHLICNSNGIIKGQIKSKVVDELDPETKTTETVAQITFLVNICENLDEALKKYKDE